MSRAGDAVELMQVVRQNAQVDQAAAEFGERFGIVINSAQEHGLIKNRDAGIDQPRDGPLDLIINFVRMIRVDHENRRQSRAGEPIDR